MARLLIADDDEAFRRMLRRMLEAAGHQVTEARDGREACELYRALPADLVITDILMPGAEGTETILNLRALFPRVRVIAISGGGGPDTKLNLLVAEKLGARRTLTKPFTQKELLDAVADVLAEPHA